MPDLPGLIAPDGTVWLPGRTFELAATPAPDVRNDFEGGTSGVAITTGNAGGAGNTQFDQVTASATCTATFDSSHAAHGGLGFKMLLGTTAGESYVMWSAKLGGSASTRYERAYLYLAAAPAAAVGVFRWLAVTVLRATVTLTAARTLQVKDSAGTAQATGAVVIPTGQWVRVEARFAGSAAAGQVEARLWLTADSTGAPDETVTASAINTGGPSDGTRYGHSGTGVASVTYWLDDLGSSPSGWLGPAQVVVANPVAAADAGAGSDSLLIAATAPLADAGAAGDLLPKTLGEQGSAGDALRAPAAVALAETARAGADVVWGIVHSTFDTTRPAVLQVTTGAVAKTLSDAGSAADGLTIAAAVPLGDTGQAGDQLTVAAARPLPDAGQGADALTATAAVPLPEQGAASDALSVDQGATPKALADAGSAGDALTVTAAMPLAEAGSAGDALAAAATATLADQGLASDALSAAQPVTASDAGAGTDGITAAAAVPLGDTGQAGEQASTTATLPLADQGAGADALSVLQGLPVTLADQGAAGDSLPTAAAVPLTEQGAASDQLSVNYPKTLADAGIAADQLSVNVAKPIGDQGLAADGLLVVATVPLADLAAAADQLAAAALAQLADAAAASDALGVAVALPFTVGVLTADAAASAWFTTADAPTATLTASEQAGGPT